MPPTQARRDFFCRFLFFCVGHLVGLLLQFIANDGRYVVPLCTKVDDGEVEVGEFLRRCTIKDVFRLDGRFLLFRCVVRDDAGQ